MFEVESEIAMGLWLLSGLCRRLTWATSLAYFTCFCFVTLYETLSGESSCGCFGRVEVDPRFTLMLDVSMVAALVVFRPGMAAAPAPSHRGVRLIATILATVTAGALAGIAMGSYRQPAASGGTLVETDGLIILEPQKWVGQPFPLAGHIDVGRQLMSGTWIVLLYRHGCPTCSKALPVYRKMATDFAGSGRSVAFIEVPPYGEPIRQEGPGLWGRLEDTKEWFVTTPAVIVVEDGRVVAGWQGQAPGSKEILDAAQGETPVNQGDRQGG